MASPRKDFQSQATSGITCIYELMFKNFLKIFEPRFE
jgi:hypothetical protein